MRPVDFEGSNIVMGKPPGMSDEQCSSVPALVATDTDGFNFTLLCFMPSYEDIQAINEGRPICLKILSVPMPPVAMYTLDADGEPNI